MTDVPRETMLGLLPGHLKRMAEQMVNSELPSTRHYWRRLVGCPEEVVTDPRPIALAMDETK